MKRILVLILSLGIMLAMSSISYASSPAPASPISVTCNWLAGKDCIAGVAYDFSPETYIFSIQNGSWYSDDFPDSNYSWSIYIKSGSQSPVLLGDGLFYPDESSVGAARTSTVTKTITHLGGDIMFYMSDPDSEERDNYGTVSVAYAVVPEPVSTALFITGGLILGGRSYLRRKKVKV